VTANGGEDLLQWHILSRIDTQFILIDGRIVMSSCTARNIRRSPAFAALHFVYLIVASLLLVACGADTDTNPVQQSAPPVDLIVINADVRTVDPTTPIAEAFAIADGRFVSVGTTSEIRSLAGSNTRVIDAGAVTVLPGLIDGHTHLVSGSGLAVGVDLSEIEDKDEWLRIIAAKAATLDDGEWILGGAWDHNLSDGVLPTREMLDRVAPDNPVLLRDIDGHSSWANSLAIELAGVTADSPVPPGGQILVDPESGDLTGIFLESAASLFANAPGMADATDTVTASKPQFGWRTASALPAFMT